MDTGRSWQARLLYSGSLNCPKLPAFAHRPREDLAAALLIPSPSLPSRQSRTGICHYLYDQSTIWGFNPAFINFIVTCTPRCFLSIHKRDRRGRCQPQVSPTPSVYRCALGTLSTFDHVSPAIKVRSGKIKGQISPRSWRRRSD